MTIFLHLRFFNSPNLLACAADFQSDPVLRTSSLQIPLASSQPGAAHNRVFEVVGEITNYHIPLS